MMWGNDLITNHSLNFGEIMAIWSTLLLLCVIYINNGQKIGLTSWGTMLKMVTLVFREKKVVNNYKEKVWHTNYFYINGIDFNEF